MAAEAAEAVPPAQAEAAEALRYFITVRSWHTQQAVLEETVQEATEDTAEGAEPILEAPAEQDSNQVLMQWAEMEERRPGVREAAAEGAEAVQAAKEEAAAVAAEGTAAEEAAAVSILPGQEGRVEQMAETETAATAA